MKLIRQQLHLCFASLLAITPSLALSITPRSAVATTKFSQRSIGYGSTKTVSNSLALNWYELDSTKGLTTVQGDPSAFYNCAGPMMNDYPSITEWLSFDKIWEINLPHIASVNSQAGSSFPSLIHDAIQKVSQDSKVDARLILAVVLQESAGNANVACTDVNHCGLMQAPPGSGSFDAKDPSGSILNMIQDGVYGIDPLRAVQASENLPHGAPGLLQYLNGGPDDLYWIDSQYWGNPYAAVHLYNGGTISSQHLTREEYGNPKTKVYANDITSRLTGWDGAPAGCMASVKCPGALRTADSCGS